MPRPRQMLFFILFILASLFLANFGKLVSIPIFVLLVFIAATYTTTFFGSSWAPVRKTTAAKMVEEAEIVSGSKIYDIGSGDGRIVVEAAKRGAHACGIEIEPLKYIISKLKIKVCGIKNADIKRGDFFKTDIRDADAVFIYLPQPTVDKLQKKLKCLRKNTTVVSCFSRCKDLPLIKELKKDKIYVYKIK